MARVFLWRPKGINVGHLSMELDEDKTYISFWPGTTDKVKLILGEPASICTLEQDKRNEERDFDEYLAIPERFIYQQNIAKWWSDQMSKSYSLLNYNCARCVYDALQAGGFDVYHKNHFLSAGAYIPRAPDENDLDEAYFQATGDVLERNWSGIESKPVIPETTFYWIKKHVENKIKNENKQEKKCTVF